MTVCETKQHYDTEFEATVQAARASYEHGDEYEPYQCGKHWHITHTDLTKRRGYGHSAWRCPKCKQLMKQTKAKEHRC